MEMAERNELYSLFGEVETAMGDLYRTAELHVQLHENIHPDAESLAKERAHLRYGLYVLSKVRDLLAAESPETVEVEMDAADMAEAHVEIGERLKEEFGEGYAGKHNAQPEGGNALG